MGKHRPMRLRRLLSQGITTVRTEGLRTFLMKTKSLVSSRIERRLSRFDLYWRYAPRFYCLVRSHDVDDYDAPCNPYKIEWIDPDDIKEVTRRPKPMKYNVLGEVWDGNWDQRDEFEFSEGYPRKREMQYKHQSMKFEDTMFYQSLYNHFVNNIPWEDTEYVQYEIQKTEQGKRAWGRSHTREELLDHCASVDELYQCIKHDGYLPQDKLKHSSTVPEARRNEILVDIGRNGQLLYVDSRHRLAIAKILELDSVPVAFGVRHTAWMELRDQIYTGSESATHPDLREF